MRITILQGAFLPVPPLRGGAIEKAWQGLGKAFAQAGHQVTHISRLFDDLPVEETLEGVRHLRVRGAEASKNSTILKIRELFYILRARKVLPKADLIVTHAFWAPLILPQEKYGKIYVHVGRYPKGQMKIYSKAARLQAPSNVVADAIASELPDGDRRVSSIPYPLPISTGKEIPIADRPKRVLYAGRIHPEKGVLDLVRAWRKLPDSILREWDLRLVGAWREDQGGGGIGFLKRIKKEAGQTVEIIEPIFDDVKLIKQYEDARIFVYPSKAKRGETFGLAVLEAMRSGCVPLVSSLKCFEDFIDNHVNGVRLTSGQNQLDNLLMNALLGLLGSPRLQTLSQEAIKTAKRYEINQVTPLFLKDFEKLIGV